MEPVFYFESCEQRPDSSTAVCSAARRDDREVVCHSADSHVPTEPCHSADSHVPLDYRVKRRRWRHSCISPLLRHLKQLKSLRLLRTFEVLPADEIY